LRSAARFVHLCVYKLEPAAVLPATCPSGMTRTTLNFWVDVSLLVLLLALLFVGVVVTFVFPPAEGSIGWTLWGLTHRQWSTLQFSLLALFALDVLLHVMLHWTWVCGVVASWMARDEGKKLKLDDGVQTLYGVALLIVLFNLFGAAVAVAMLTIRGP
jgi:hypothetical protein